MSRRAGAVGTAAPALSFGAVRKELRGALADAGAAGQQASRGRGTPDAPATEPAVSSATMAGAGYRPVASRCVPLHPGKGRSQVDPKDRRDGAGRFGTQGTKQGGGLPGSFREGPVDRWLAAREHQGCRPTFRVGRGKQAAGARPPAG